MPDDPQIDALKLPPHSLEAEQSVLGGLLLDNEAADRVGDVVFAADFYSEAHRVIYDHIVRLIADGRPADVVTLAESLGSSQKLDYIGGLAYLGALVQNVPTAANIRHYAQIVRDRSILRQLASTAGEIADSAYNPLGRNAKMVLDEAEAKVLHIAEQGSRGTQSYPGDRQAAGDGRRADRDALQPRQSVGRHGRADRLRRSGPDDVGVSAGGFDRVAGRPSMGKTALALNIGEHVALHHKETGRRVLDGNGRDAARAADDRLGRPPRPAQASHRPPGTGGLGQAVDRAGPAERSADPDRRNARAQRDRSPLARAADHEAARRVGARRSSTTCS